MAWLNYGGHDAADFPLNIQGHGTIPAYLLHPQNQVADLIARVAPALKAYLDKKKNDEIANEVMNMQNPPRAEAVDQYGATYDPSLAARQGWTGPTEPPTRAPATGGADAFRAQQMYQAILDKQQADKDQSTNDYWKNWLIQRQGNKLQAEADAPDTRVAIQLPDGRTAMVTPNEAAQYYHYRQPKADPWENAVPVARGTLNRTVNGSLIDTNAKPGEFTNQYTGAESGDQVKLVTPTGYSVTVPWTAYQARSGRFSGAQAFQDRQQSQPPELPAPDLPAITPEQSTSAPAAKQLDAATAKAILVEAGGDRDKARQIAKSRGYTF